MIDLRGILPRANWSIGDTTKYRPVTAVHWAGNPVTWLNDPVRQLKAFATYHIQKDWGGGANGDGIMYHYAVDIDGRAYQLRDETAILYNTGAAGNYESIAVLAIIGTGQPPTEALFHGLDDVITYLARPTLFGHRDYGTSHCPGDDIYNWLRGWPYDWGNGLTEAEVSAMINAYGARLQPELEVDRKRIDALEEWQQRVRA